MGGVPKTATGLQQQTQEQHQGEEQREDYRDDAEVEDGFYSATAVIIDHQEEQISVEVSPCERTRHQLPQNHVPLDRVEAFFIPKPPMNATENY